MSQLKIAKNFNLPYEAVTQTFGILAKRGAGKTYTASVMAEEMLDNGLHVVIADPIGVWWGLRTSADGKKPGHSIIVFGGDHADVPLDKNSGALVADTIIKGKIPAILDLSLFRKGEQATFMTAFCERLYQKNRNPLHLIMDEADAFAPQRPMPGTQRLLGAVEDIVRRGRARGLGVTLITQRPAVLNKNVLTQIEVLITLRIVAPQDRKAIDDWINIHGTPEQRKELMTSLASLPIGTAWFWSPGWLDEFKKIEVRKRKTFDSSVTPKVGDKPIIPTNLAKVDIEQLRTHMAGMIEEITANDPKELKKQVAKLQRELATRPAVEPERVEVSVIKPEEITGINNIIQSLHDPIENLMIMKSDLDNDINNLENKIKNLITVLEQVKHHPAPIRSVNRTPAQQSQPRATASNNDTDIIISRPQQRILNSLAKLESVGVTRPNKFVVAAYASVSPKSGSFANNLGRLRAQGLIDYPGSGLAALTQDGRELAEQPDAIPDLDELHNAWRELLSNPQEKIINYLINIYPQPVDKEVLAENAGVSFTSGSYANNLGRLRTLGIIDYPSRGRAVATELLFPEGLT